MQIYITRDGQRLGPYSVEDVNAQLAAGTVSATDLAWYEGIPSWIPLSSIAGISAGAGTTPGAMPAVAASSLAPASGNYAGFWIRVVAYIIDGIILMIPIGILQFLLKGNADDPTSGHPVLLVFLILAIEVGYFAGLWSSGAQATLGQKVCGMRVVRSADGARISFGRGILRMLGIMISSAILCIGFLMVAFTERKQGLHDMIAGTYVLKNS